MAISLGELATQFGCELIGDADVLVDNVASLNNANSSSLTNSTACCNGSRRASSAAAVGSLRDDDAKNSPTASVINENPYAWFARVSSAIVPARFFEPGIHPAAHVSSMATIAA